ncbi:MAG: hypothetical protein ACPGVT_06290 [Maricaulaceae bacterium]
MQKNQSYLKDWDVYQAERREKRVKHPILLPMTLMMDSKKGFVPELMSIEQVKDVQKTFNLTNFKHWAQWPLMYGKPDLIFSDYLDYFGSLKGEKPCKSGADLEANSPLDLYCCHPTWLVFRLKNSNWSFSKLRQYSTENDADDMYRNFEKVTLLDAQTLILHNRCLSQHEGLKFNLHVTVAQTFEGRAMQTDIIIDPGMNNDPPVTLLDP